jgi:hypothetical protein
MQVSLLIALIQVSIIDDYIAHYDQESVTSAAPKNIPTAKSVPAQAENAPTHPSSAINFYPSTPYTNQ